MLLIYYAAEQIAPKGDNKVYSNSKVYSTNSASNAHGPVLPTNPYPDMDPVLHFFLFLPTCQSNSTGSGIGQLSSDDECGLAWQPITTILDLQLNIRQSTLMLNKGRSIRVYKNNNKNNNV